MDLMIQFHLHNCGSVLLEVEDNLGANIVDGQRRRSGGEAQQCNGLSHTAWLGKAVGVGCVFLGVGECDTCRTKERR